MFLKSVLWDYMGRLSAQAVGFIISIILARLLEPEDFGIVGILLVFIGISQTILDMGFGAALVQKEKVNNEEFSTVFYLNLVVGCVLSISFFFSSDVIAAFFGKDILSPISKVFSITFIIHSLSIIHLSKLKREINFKILAKINLIVSTCSGFIGILLAFSNMGVWSLVGQHLSFAFLNLISLWYTVPWRPNKKAKLSYIDGLWKFGYKVFLASITNAIFSRLDILIVGKLFSPLTLGFYSRAKSMENFIIQNTSQSINQVFFSVSSKIQTDLSKLKDYTQDILSIIGFLVFGLIGLLYLSAENIFILLFTEKWLNSIPYFKIILMGSFAYPFGSILVNIILGTGNSGVNLRLALIKRGLTLVSFAVGYYFGMIGFLYSMVAINFIGTFLNMYFVSRIINFHFFDQLRKYFLWNVLFCIFSYMIANLINHWLLHDQKVLNIIECSVIYLTSYIGLNYIFNFDFLIYFKMRFIDIIKNISSLW